MSDDAMIEELAFDLTNDGLLDALFVLDCQLADGELTEREHDGKHLDAINAGAKRLVKSGWTKREEVGDE